MKNLDNEIWVDVKGYEGLYQVSNLGRVKSLDRKIIDCNSKKFFLKGKILKLTNCKGYNIVGLHNKGKVKTKRVCILVCYHFNFKPNNKNYVNHIDGIKNNDYYLNLEWCTAKENMQHALINNLLNIKYGKDCNNSKKVLCLKTNKIYNTIKEASKYSKFSESYLSRMLSGKRKNISNLIYV